MSTRDTHIERTASVARQAITFPVNTPGGALAAQRLAARHFDRSFRIEDVELFTRTYTAAMQVRGLLLLPNRVTPAPTLAIGGTATLIQLQNAIEAVFGAGPQQVPSYLAKAAENNIAWGATAGRTVNANATGGGFGAFRVQMTPAGVITLTASSLDQDFADAASAQAAAPPADPNNVNLGTVTVQCATTTVFTAGTTALNAAGVTTTFQPVADGVVELFPLTAFAAGVIVKPVVTANELNRRSNRNGGLLILTQTSDGTGAVANASVTIEHRPWPMRGDGAPPL